MKVTIDRSVLLKALGHVQRVVERRTTIPILSNVLIRAEGGAMRLKATDLDLEVSEVLPAEVSSPGDVTLPAHTLHDIVRKLPDGDQVTLERLGDDGQMTLRSGRSRFSLQSLPASDFPELASGDMGHRFAIRASELKGLLDRTAFAISTEETRYYLNGVYLHAATARDGSPTLRMVSTDGHRLAQVEMTLPDGAAGMPGIIVPRKAAGEVGRLFDDAEATISVEVSPTKIRFTIGDVVLTSKVIDGTFPNYERVIPAGNDKALVVDKAAFSAAVDRVSTISSERGRAVKMTLSEGHMVLSVTNPDAGTAVEELEVEYDSAPMEIGFNSRYVIEVVAQLEGPKATMMLSDPGSPVLFDPGPTSDALYVLMPMRV